MYNNQKHRFLCVEFCVSVNLENDTAITWNRFRGSGVRVAGNKRVNNIVKAIGRFKAACGVSQRF